MTKPCECRDSDGDVCQRAEGHEGPHYGQFGSYHYVWDRPGSKACEVPRDETTPLQGWIPGLAEQRVINARRRGERTGYVIDEAPAPAPAPAPDPINRPAHYTAHPSGVECITIAEHFGFCIGNAIKYLWRAGLKNNALEDLRKAKWYIEREIARREKGGAKC